MTGADLIADAEAMQRRLGIRFWNPFYWFALAVAYKHFRDTMPPPSPR